MLNLELRIAGSHLNGLAKIGETVNFSAQFVVWGPSRKIFDAEIRYRIIRNGETEVKKGSVSSASSLGVSFIPEQPGWYHCTFDAYFCGEQCVSRGIGVLVAPETMKPHLPVPEDFDSFWEKQLERQRAVPLQMKLKKMESDEFLEAWDLEAQCAEGLRLTGEFMRPLHAEKGKHPALLLPQGAGVRTSGANFVGTGMASRGFLTLDYNPFGIDNNQSPAWYQQQGERIGSYMFEGFDSGDPEKVFMRKVFLRTARALECLKSMPEWDGRNLLVAGGSQGAWQSIAAAMLDHDVSCVAVYIPAGCDLGGGGWPFMHLAGQIHTLTPEMKKTFPYFDACSFASRIGMIPVQFTAGLIDTVCKADGVMAAYNQLKTPEKKLLLHFQMFHESMESVLAGQQEFLLKNLR